MLADLFRTLGGIKITLMEKPSFIVKPSFDKMDSTKCVTMYGWVCDLNKIAYAVSHAVNPKNELTAQKLLMETAAVETKLGQAKDTTKFAGMGLCQIDREPFYDIRKRGYFLRKRILNELGIDIELIEWEDLRYNTLLSLLFCRMHYYLIPRPIPHTLSARAKYWKRYYNTKLGKGRVSHYIESSKLVYIA